MLPALKTSQFGSMPVPKTCGCRVSKQSVMHWSNEGFIPNGTTSQARTKRSTGSSTCRTICASTAANCAPEPRRNRKSLLARPVGLYTALRSMVPACARLLCALLFLASLGWPVTSFAGGSNALAGTPIRSVYVRAARGANPNTPQQVIVALHGMGGNGEAFGRDLIEQADRYGWLLVAPTIDYGDWKDPNQVAREDPKLISALSDYLD